ncbi:dynein axonemal heavy chain 12-like [Anoplolepis gracilipes]|uniref:dynein axonemal heavy chain 12-like n=1 Tax=Anoplolepis gracilipes TaxID=354296 RepID=UPI003B9E89A4
MIKRWSSISDIAKIVSEDTKCLPLHDFTLSKLLAMEIQDVLEAASTKAKMHHYERFDIHLTECELAESQNFYFNKMRNAAEKVPISGLLPEWEDNIRDLSRLQLYSKYKDIYEEQMQETKERYYKTIRDTEIRRIILIECEEACNENSFAILPYKYPGHTEFTVKFRKNRCVFVKQYYLSHRLIRSIVEKAHLLLPKIFCDLEHYRSFDFLDIDKFFEFVEADLKKNAHIIITLYYNNIVRLVSQRRYIQDVPSNILMRFLKCATTILGLQIITRATDTIKHLLSILADPTKIPLLKLELRCESNDLFVSPRLEELADAFHNLVDKIANIACHLSPLESWVRMKGKRIQEKERSMAEINIAMNNKPTFISLPSWYLDEVHQRLSVVLRESFRPLNNYLEELRLRFGCIVYEIDRDAAVALMNAGTERFFEEYIAKVEDFNQLVRVINKMPDNEYLVTTKLNQVSAKRNLVAYANELRELIIDKLVQHHWTYNLEICTTFEMLKERALNIPRTTKELLELGQYMLKATSTLMIELQSKIALSLSMMSSLIEMTTLSRHHIELNSTTVQWLKRIRPIFERNSAMYEQMKFDLEEKLQEETVILNARVEDVFPRLIVMNDMDNAERIKEYIEDMRKIVRQLKRMEQKAEWINAEEALFQFPLSTYPRIKELKENILPFYALIYRSYQWQRDRGVWLDGPFEYLNVQYIEDKLNQYLIDFTKTNKQYKTRIKMQIAINYPYSFAGLVDDPDPFQQPAPLKLCHQLAEDVKWFKQYVALLAIFRNPAMRQLHWDNMSTIAGFDLTPDAGTTLRKIINMNLMEDLEKYEIISSGATKELAHEQSLAKMITDWENLDDILMLLEEHIIKIQAMQGSAFIKVIENDVKFFYELLLRMQSTIDEWTKVQQLTSMCSL